MSTQRGNTSRTRAQKHKNRTVFKNDLHDTSHTTKFINSLTINNVCARCKDILDWKIKYKKYKPLKSPSTCVKCHNKNIKFAYHTVCTDCAKKSKVCPKCGKEESLIKPTTTVSTEKILKNQEIKDIVKSLSERQRRTFHRNLDKMVEAAEDPNNIEEDILHKLKEMALNHKTSDDFDLDDDDDDLDSDESED